MYRSALLRLSLTFLALSSASALSLMAAEPAAAPAKAPANAKATLTYCRDIAPIFRKSCESCHRTGEVATMSLLTYADTRPWLRSIKKEVASRTMPPWHADPKYGDFSNDPTLSEKDVKTIVDWIDSGAEEGDPKDLPPATEWAEGWRIGKPDVVFEIPQPFDVPATGVVPYKYFTVETGFTEDKWIAMADARPGSPEVVHHILVFVMKKAAFLNRRKRRGNLLERELVGFAPGEGPAIFKPGTAKLVPADSILLFQLHYTPNGTAQSDQSRVGLIFAKEPVKKEIYTKVAMNRRFRIPPHAENHEVEAWSRTFKRDTLLHSLMPHMHLRGKSFEFRLVTPDGAEKTLLSVPEYDFDWQRFYSFKKPLMIKEGSKVRCIAHFDNSKKNAANPDPDTTVRWGDQTWEEMMIGFLTVSRPVDNGKKDSADALKKAAIEKF